jgi:6-pyruvoyltetrahydropterin/6-carboxytetrahydropterin synthase
LTKIRLSDKQTKGLMQRSSGVLGSIPQFKGVVQLKQLHEIKIVTQFAAAHNLRNYKGKCERLHGHNWKVEVTLRGTKLNDAGMLIDFADVKQVTREVLAELDHNYLNELPFFKSENPSSENIARYLSDRLSERLNTEDRWLYKVSAWESSDACATVISDRER